MRNSRWMETVNPEGLMCVGSMEEAAKVMDVLLQNGYEVKVSMDVGMYQLAYCWIGDGTTGVELGFFAEDWDGDEDSENS